VLFNTARLALNYKKLDYKTEWLEYPDVEPTLKNQSVPSSLIHHLSHPLNTIPRSVPPRTEGFAYTIPTVRLVSGTYINDSRAIATALETAHPSPSLLLDSPMLPRMEAALGAVMAHLAAELLPGVPGALLNPPSEEYFQRTRAQRFGMPLAQLKADKGGEGAWKAAEEPLRGMAALLKERGGPFCEGEEVSYADFVAVSFLQFVRRIEEKDFDRVCKLDEAFAKVYEASKEWLEKDD